LGLRHQQPIQGRHQMGKSQTTIQIGSMRPSHAIQAIISSCFIMIALAQTMRLGGSASLIKKRVV
jgi:hypothetical protein